MSPAPPHLQITKHIRVRATEGGGGCDACSRPAARRGRRSGKASAAGRLLHQHLCMGPPKPAQSTAPSPARPPRAAGPGPLGSSELGTFTPTFLWLLRDFYFDLSEEGRKVGAHAQCWDYAVAEQAARPLILIRSQGPLRFAAGTPNRTRPQPLTGPARWCAPHPRCRRGSTSRRP